METMNGSVLFYQTRTGNLQQFKVKLHAWVEDQEINLCSFNAFLKPHPPKTYKNMHNWQPQNYNSTEETN